MPFGLFTDNKGVYRRSFQAGSNGRCGGDGVCTHRQTADAIDLTTEGLDLFPEGLADQQTAAGMQGGLFAIKIKITFSP